MPTYIKTVIYKLICKDITIVDCYVGHTTNKKSRINEHKYACNNSNSKSYNAKLYETIRNTGGWDNWSLVEIEAYPCDTKEQAHSREQFWIHSLNANLNMISAVLDIDNKLQKLEDYRLKLHNEALEREAIRKQEREQYLIENKDKIKERQIQVRKEYVLKNRDYINKRMREYNQKTKERLADRAKKYYDNRKANGYYKKE
jgi:hypothetical protein